jgi:transposase
MSNEDARSLPGAAQAALRKRAVEAVRGGMTQAEAARVFAVHLNAVNRWIKRYREVGLPGFLWTREAVAEVIAQRCGVWLVPTTVGRYLRLWKFSPQRPQRRALEQNPAAVHRWPRRPTRHPCPSQAGGWGGVVGWMSWGCAPTMPRGSRGRQSARPRSSSAPASGSG